MALDYQTEVGEYTTTTTAVDTSALIKKVYAWMCLALAVTGLVSLFTASSEMMLNFVFGSRYMFYVLIFGELGVVIYLSARIAKMSFSSAMMWFIIYSVLNGLTLSVIFLAFTAASIAGTFFITAGMFGAMSLIGYTTKKDLTKVGSFLMMLLIGLIIATFVNLFLNSNALSWIISLVGVVVFTGLTAFDTQKVKQLLSMAQTDEVGKKIALMGALTLYLDFINLFLYLLRFLGNRK